jgi:hypothetical protein
MSGGASVPPPLTYALENPIIVNTDGSWSFYAVVTGDSGRPSQYRWEVSAAGLVTGWKHVPGSRVAPPPIGPLHYVPGSSDCTA